MPKTPTPAHASAEGVATEPPDVREREAAAADDAALVEYQAKWQRKLRRLQRTFPERWRVQGLSDAEVLDRLTLRLIEAVRAPGPDDREPPQSGREWGLLIAGRELASLRRRFRLPIISADVGEAPFALSVADPEGQYLEAEDEQRLLVAAARAEQSLSLPQRRWLAALHTSARAEGFFAASDELNLAAAARVVGKNRSSAQRGYRELQARFASELARFK